MTLDGRDPGRAGAGVAVAADRSRPTDGLVRRALVGSDLLAAGLAWAVALQLTVATDGRPASGAVLLWSLVGAVITVGVLVREQAYRTKVWGVRALEVQRIGRGGLLAGVLIVGVDAVAGGPLRPAGAVFAVVLAGALIVAGRSATLTWLRVVPAAGVRHRSLLLAADAETGQDVRALLDEHPRLGYDLVGLVSAERPTAGATDLRWVGRPPDLPVLTRLTAADSVLVAGDAFVPGELDALLDRLAPLDVHTHLVSSDLDGVPHVRVAPLRTRAATTCRRPSLSRLQRCAKRALDLLAGGLLAVLALPVVAVAAVLLRATNGAQVLVTEDRATPRGDVVRLWRLRTSGAEPGSVAAQVTGLCRRLGVDRLPQLANVLVGSMTLVGPSAGAGRRERRPAATLDVSPGLIGLRHVETLDYPQLGPHRRADEFYIEHWSVGLDLSIIVACASDIVWRGLRHLAGGARDGTATA